MDFKIDKNRNSIGLKNEGGATLSARGADLLGDSKSELYRTREPESKEELAAYGKEVAATGDSLVISNIKNRLSTANEGIDEILLLKGKVLNYAQLTAALPEVSAMHATVQEEVNNVMEQVYDIQSSLQVSISQKGDGLVDPNTYVVSNPAENISSAVSTSRIFTSERRYSIENSTNAADAVTDLEAEFVSYRANKAAYSAAASKAEHLIPVSKEEIFTVKDTRPNTLESVEEAQRLANSVAQKLGSAYGDEQTTSKLIESSTEGLRLDRVKDLLS